MSFIEAIQSGVLVAGERLLVDEVTAHFGISKIPVREAFKALEAADWLEAPPRRGTFVKRLSANELHSAFEMRKMIEPHSARLAALRRSSTQLAQLKSLIQKGKRAAQQADTV